MTQAAVDPLSQAVEAREQGHAGRQGDPLVLAAGQARQPPRGTGLRPHQDARGLVERLTVQLLHQELKVAVGPQPAPDLPRRDVRPRGGLGDRLAAGQGGRDQLAAEG